jgi:hypothetical protein
MQDASLNGWEVMSVKVSEGGLGRRIVTLSPPVPLSAGEENTPLFDPETGQSLRLAPTRSADRSPMSSEMRACPPPRQKREIRELVPSEADLDKSAVLERRLNLCVSEQSKSLNLSAQQVGPYGAVVLSKFLPECIELCALDLADNNIGRRWDSAAGWVYDATGVVSLIDAMINIDVPILHRLSTLKLSKNALLTVDAGHALADLLAANVPITSLDLSDNYEVDADVPGFTIALMAGMEANCRLLSLNLGCNNLSRGGLREGHDAAFDTSYATDTMGLQAVAEALVSSHCPLTMVDISNNRYANEKCQYHRSCCIIICALCAAFAQLQAATSHSWLVRSARTARWL